MEENTMNEAAADSQAERDAEERAIPNHTKTTDLSDIPEPQPHSNGYSGPITK